MRGSSGSFAPLRMTARTDLKAEAYAEAKAIDVRVLSEGGDGGWVHVVVGLVFSAHAPDEAVIFGADAGVDRPCGGDYDLLVGHD